MAERCAGRRSVSILVPVALMPIAVEAKIITSRKQVRIKVLIMACCSACLLLLSSTPLT